MSAKRIFAIVLRQLFLLRKNLTRFINIFVWSTLDVVVWGFITRYLNRVGEADFNFIPVFLGAAILWNFLVRIQQGIILPFFEDMWSRNFLNLFASPLKVHEYMAGLIVTSVLTSMAGFAAMLAFASLFFDYQLFSIGGPLLLFIFLLFVFGFSLGMLTIAFVLRFGPSAEWFGWVVPWLLSPFSGVFYPIATLPEQMQYLSRFVPPSYVFEGLRGLLLNRTFLSEPLFAGLAISGVYLVAAYLVFIAVFKTVVKKGLFVRLTAEM
ncbi:ABC transporter permease [Candidatus Parcubacteria bacterium]|nr:MAG: ABC transporter permease [Candidatus Parcubacteria bacterium]